MNNILLIFFLIFENHCQQGNEKVSLKSIKLKVLHKSFCKGLPNSASHNNKRIFYFAPKLITTLLTSYCVSFWDSVYPSAMPGSPGELKIEKY